MHPPLRVASEFDLWCWQTPGVSQILQGAVLAGVGLELIPAALIIGGLRLKKSGSNEARPQAD